ncbi:MAG: hypothetical protein Q8R44_05955 [Novosphingobium sp.]|nr:hypothetical protein [Novosphingobium sp.]
MIDNFALGLIHLLLAIAVWKLLLRPDLDRDADEPQTPSIRLRKPRRDRR